MKIVWSSFEEAVGSLKRCAGLALLLALTLVTVRVYVITLPKLDAEIDEAHRASTEGALTLMGTRKLSAAELKALPETQGKINSAIDSVTAAASSAKETLGALTENQNAVTVSLIADLDGLHGSEGALTNLLNASTKSVEGLQPVEKQVADEVAEVHKATVNLDAVAGDPAIHASLQNVQTATGNVADMSKMTKEKLNSILHPKWPSVLGNIVERIGVDVGKIFL